MKKIIISTMAALILSACGSSRSDWGFEKNAPDEMMVVSRAPLSIPPEFGLRPLVVESDDFSEEKNLSVGEKALLSHMN